MRIKVRHETIYRYREPAQAVIQQLRLTPRNFDSQFVRSWRVETDSDCKLYRGEDAYGNPLHSFSIDGPVEEVRILAEGDVETTESAGVIRGALDRYSPLFWQRETALTHATAPIRDFARDIASGEGGDTLSTLHAINAALFRDMAFTPGATDAGTPAGDAFVRRTGVCQDFAQVFIAATRVLGLPARYVSGYYLRTDMQEQEAGHAWAEVLVDGIGWLGFDPAHGICVTDRYVRVAAGLDYLDAAPIRGARIGGGGETLDVIVHVSQGPAIIDV